MAQASIISPHIVRKHQFLKNCCMDPGQILWAAPYPPYLQTIFIALLDFVSRVTLLAQSSVVQYLLTHVSQTPPHGSRPNFMEATYPPHLQTVFFPFFKNFTFQFLRFYFVCFVFVNMGPYGS